MGNSRRSDRPDGARAAAREGEAACGAIVDAVGDSLRRLMGLTAGVASDAPVGVPVDAIVGVPVDATVVVALSGGVDSVVLLDAVAQCHPRERIVACHVHHGLQAQADRWSAACEDQARRIAVAFALERIESRPRTGENVEAWARTVRYRALWREVERTDAAALLTAHQADDQLETVLMRLARGSGPEALGAMSPARRRRGRWLLRPLLSIGRETIVAYAKARALQWIDDPMNDDERFLRVALRARLIPEFARVVPSLRENVLRSAELLRETGETLRWVAERDLREAGLAPDGRSIDRRRLTKLPPSRRDRAVRAWFETLGTTMPNRGRLAQWIGQMLLGDSAYGEVVHEGWRFRRYRDRIVVDVIAQAHDATPPPHAFSWQGEAEIALPAWGGWLFFESATQADGPDAHWLGRQRLEVRTPRGTARLRPRHGGPSRTVKNLFQESGVPPWLRTRMPALYAGDRLLYVAGLGMDRSPFPPTDDFAPTGKFPPTNESPATGERRVTIRWVPDDPDDPRAAFGEVPAPV